MKEVTVQNYREDRYYPQVVRVTEELLAAHGYVSPVMLFQGLELLAKKDVEAWRRGRVPCLEKVIGCNLSKASRILRVLRFHAHDLNLVPSRTIYKRTTSGGRPVLQFSKSGQAKLEEVYSTHMVSPATKSGRVEKKAE